MAGGAAVGEGDGDGVGVGLVTLTPPYSFDTTGGGGIAPASMQQYQHHFPLCVTQKITKQTSTLVKNRL